MRNDLGTKGASKNKQSLSPATSEVGGVNAAMKYLNDFAQNGGIFTYPKFETFDISGNPRVLVLAPHPDDDVIGCGGTIAKCVKQGSQVKVLYMTDGRHGNSQIPVQTLIRMRKMEAKAGLRVIGCDDANFLDNPDMGLICDRKNVQRVLAMIREFRPTAVFVPSFWEMPPDHLETARIAAHAAREFEGDVDWYCYEVWCPVVSDPKFHIIIVDITEMIELKMEAINEHRSQVSVNDYAPKIAGLNAYRSMYASRGVEYCEAFIEFSREEFVEHARSRGAFKNEK